MSDDIDVDAVLAELDAVIDNKSSTKFNSNSSNILKTNQKNNHENSNHSNLIDMNFDSPSYQQPTKNETITINSNPNQIKSSFDSDEDDYIQSIVNEIDSTMNKESNHNNSSNNQTKSAHKNTNNHNQNQERSKQLTLRISDFDSPDEDSYKSNTSNNHLNSSNNNQRNNNSNNSHNRFMIESKENETKQLNSSNATKCYPPILSCFESNKNSYCHRLHCLSCDFTVLRFSNCKWSNSMNYLYCRNHMPSIEKLSLNLIETSSQSNNSSSYCCQCNWFTCQTESIQVSEIPKNEETKQSFRWTCQGCNKT